MCKAEYKIVMNVVKCVGLSPKMASVQHKISSGRSIECITCGTQEDNFHKHNLLSAIFEFLTRAFTMQGCRELTDFVHFSAFSQYLLCSADYKLSDLKYVF